jgi:hypothetical protein
MTYGRENSAVMTMPLRRNWKLTFTFFALLFLIALRGGAASSQPPDAIPAFIHFFLLINFFLLALATVLMLCVKRKFPTYVWDNNIIANSFNMLHTLALALILNKLYYSESFFILLLIGSLYTFAVLMVVTTEYYLVKPLAPKLNLSKATYIIFCVCLPLILWRISLSTLFWELPRFPYPSYLIFFLFFYAFTIIFFTYVTLLISKQYEKIGFVQKPFLSAGAGMIAIISALILITLHTKAIWSQYYYYLAFYFIVSAFTSIYYLKFIIEYPAFLQPKWKSFMPFDFPKVAAALNLGFLAASFYFTAREYPAFALYQNIPYIAVAGFLLPLFLGTLLIFGYLDAISSRTKLRYWSYLRLGTQTHLAVTLYVFSLIFLSWSVATSKMKLLVVFFGLFSFAFYLAFALDLRTILRDQAIVPVFKRLDILLYLFFFSSIFSLLFFTHSFTYGRVTFFGSIEFVSYPLILFFIVFFLIAFGAYLSITHKGFEEVMQKNVWSELSYIFAFVVFLLVYLLYSSLSEHLHHYPYHNLAFIGYFAVLLIEIFSTMTLTGKSKYQKTEKENIIHFLNFHAHNFLRTDYLEHLWEESVARYVPGEELHKISFDSLNREFHLETVDERTQVAVAVAILLAIDKMPDVEKVMIKRKSPEELKAEMVSILAEKILMLPEELRAELDMGLYYPILFERTINDLLSHLKAFIPLSDQQIIFDRLKRRDELFNCVEFEQKEIRIKEGTRFGRDKFLELFKLYLEAVGDKFPFKRCLLRGLVKEEIRTDAHAPIAASEVFDIISTGIKELNLVMAGGLVKGSITLLITEETKAKQRILHSLMTRNLPEGMSILYATSKRPYQQIQGELLMDLDSVDRVTMLDLYAPLYEEKGVSELVENDHRIIVPLSKILFQRSFVKVIKSQPRNQPWLVIIDVYDDFAKYYQPEEIYELLQTQVEGLKRWNCTAVIILNPQSPVLKKVGADEVKKNFENILVVAGAEKETVVQIEKLFHGTPGKRVVHLEW